MFLNDVAITHVRSKRKSLTLIVKPGGNVVLKTPLYTSMNEIEKFLEKQSNWIRNKVIESKQNYTHFDFQPGSLIPYKGVNLEIIIDRNKNKITLTDNSIIIPQSIDIKVQLLKWYKLKAKEQITMHVEELTKIIGITYNKIFIRNQKTRWGSCSGRKNLNFSWKVILTPPELIKYLVVHEVCHLVEMNHSKNFWELVEKYDPLFNQHSKDLQKAGYYLTTFLE